MKSLSPIFPLYLDNEGGYASNKLIKEVVKQNLKNLILTAPGERIMLPNFGVGLKRFLFSQNNQQTFSQIENTILKQVNTYMPFLSIEDLRYEAEENQMLLQMRYLIIPLEVTDILNLQT